MIIGICGGTGSGKTTLAKRIVESLGLDAQMISMDSYYSNREDLTYDERCKINYDHPNAFDLDLFISHIKELKEGREVDIPVYDFSTHLRSKEIQHIKPTPVMVIEGILLFADPRVVELLDEKIFVDTDSDIRILRRIKRDLNERARSLESVILQYTTTVKPMHEAFVEPNKKLADIIVPEGGKNVVAYEMILHSIQKKLQK